MKKHLGTIITAIVAISLLITGLIVSPINLSNLQRETLTVVSVICLISMAYCFIAGEITKNNSQMDKLWSILPIIYAWVIAIKGSMSGRLVIMAVLITIWGLRLTFNFAQKGAYSIKFWEGEEDYRWVILRENPAFKRRWAWTLFDLLFISVYQNALVLAICLPMIAVMDNARAFSYIDLIPVVLTLGFIILETIADKQQMDFYDRRKELMSTGKKLEEIEAPYNKGFNTIGLWGRSRHPNYLSEQSIWISLYLFTITAGVTSAFLFNWSIVGCTLLVLLFLGSSSMSEGISKGKYPEYENYINKVSKYIPLKKYKD